MEDCCKIVSMSDEPKILALIGAFIARARSIEARITDSRKSREREIRGRRLDVGPTALSIRADQSIHRRSDWLVNRRPRIYRLIERYSQRSSTSFASSWTFEIAGAISSSNIRFLGNRVGFHSLLQAANHRRITRARVKP
jgi:hypothetical protein